MGSTAVSALSAYDVVFVIIVLVSAVFALIRGGIAEILSLSTWFIALWSMHKFGSSLNPYIPNSIAIPLLRSIIVYVTLFIVIAILISLAKKLITPIINNIGLNGLNYLLGFIFGIIRGILICAIIIVGMELLHFDSGSSLQNSRLYPIIKPIVIWIIEIINHTLNKG